MAASGGIPAHDAASDRPLLWFMIDCGVLLSQVVASITQLSGKVEDLGAQADRVKARLAKVRESQDGGWRGSMAGCGL